VHWFEAHLFLTVVAVWFVCIAVWYACDFDGRRS
jgi:formate/nitrite transporter FocA (FNT family)